DGRGTPVVACRDDLTAECPREERKHAERGKPTRGLEPRTPSLREAQRPLRRFPAPLTSPAKFGLSRGSRQPATPARSQRSDDPQLTPGPQPPPEGMPHPRART